MAQQLTPARLVGLAELFAARASSAEVKLLLDAHPLNQLGHLSAATFPVALLAPAATSVDAHNAANNILRAALSAFQRLPGTSIDWGHSIGGVYSFVLVLAAVACANHVNPDDRSRGRIAFFLEGVEAGAASSGAQLVHSFTPEFRAKVATDIQEMVNGIS